MNDFLRPCNCVHPADEDCEKCVAEAAGEKKRGASRGVAAEKNVVGAEKSTAVKKPRKP